MNTTPLHKIIDTIQERFKNPLTGSFILAFIAFNWKAFYYIIFSKNKVENKLSLVSDYVDYNSLLFRPLIIAAIYTLIIPYLIALIEKITLQAAKFRESNANSRRSRNIDAELRVAEQLKSLNDIRTGNRQSEKLQGEISNLKSSLDSKESEILSYSERIEQLTADRNKIVHDFNNEISTAEAKNRQIANEFQESKAKGKAFQHIENNLRNELALKQDELQSSKKIIESQKEKIREFESKYFTPSNNQISLIKESIINELGDEGLKIFQEITLNISSGENITLRQGDMKVFKDHGLIKYNNNVQSYEVTPLGRVLLDYL